MNHDIIFYYFNIHMAFQSQHVIQWFPNGHNSIRVRLTNNEDFIFTYNSDKDWCYETVDSYIIRMKGERKMRC